MKLTSSIICLVALFSVPASCFITAVPNDKYNNGGNSMETVTCYNDLRARFKTLGDLPTTKIGGYQGATCGTCWAIEFNKRPIVYALSIDDSDDGFQLSHDAVVALMGGESTVPMNLQVTVTAADKAKCGL